MTRFTWWKTLSFTIVAVGLAFGIPEAVLRMVGYHPATTPLVYAGRMPGSSSILWELKPGLNVENGIPIQVNSLGLRGPEVTTPRPPGVRRLLSLGDSSVYGFGVRDNETFTALTGQALAPKVEAINGAIPGYSTYQSLRLLEKHVGVLAPDLLVIANLWSDNNFDAFVDKELLAMYAEERGDHQNRLKQILSASRLFELLEDLLSGGHVRRVGWMLGSSERSGKRRVEINDYARNLETLTRFAREHHAEVLFLVLPNDEDMLNIGDTIKAWDCYRQVMRDTARRNGTLLIEAPELFRNSGLTKDELFIDHMHPTARGHRVIAEGLIAALKLTGWAEGSSITGQGDGSAIPPYRDTHVHLVWLADLRNFVRNIWYTLQDIIREPSPETLPPPPPGSAVRQGNQPSRPMMRHGLPPQ